MFSEVKKILAKEKTECPTCSELINKGEIMYKDEYRNEIICHHCLNDYKKIIIQEEGVDGFLLR